MVPVLFHTIYMGAQYPTPKFRKGILVDWHRKKYGRMKHKKERNYKKIALISVLGVTLVAGGTAACAAAYEAYYRVPVELKQKEFVYEYGDSISQDIKEYFTILEKDKLNDCVLKITVPENERIETGDYKGKLSFRNTDISFKIKVLDTIPPEFVDFKEAIQIDINNTKEQLLSQYSATDLSGTAIDIDDSQVNYTAAGKYAITVIATDGHSNTSSRDAAVEVIAPVIETSPAEESAQSQSLQKNTSSQNSSKKSSSSQSESSQSSSSQKPSQSILSYTNITIPGVCSQAKITLGNSQSDVNANNIVMDNMVALRPGMGGAILVYGHNTRSLKGLYNASVGSVITVQYDGNIYSYKITDSAECRTSGNDLTNVRTGVDMLDLGAKNETLIIYTCHGPSNGRWTVKASRI